MHVRAIGRPRARQMPCGWALSRDKSWRYRRYPPRTPRSSSSDYFSPVLLACAPYLTNSPWGTGVLGEDLDKTLHADRQRAGARDGDHVIRNYPGKDVVPIAEIIVGVVKRGTVPI